MLDMIKCSTGGAYYARGEWVPADGNADAALAARGVVAAAIANAKTGLYWEKSIEGVPEDLKKKYFTKIGPSYKIADEIKEWEDFHQNNLLMDTYPTDCNLIVCRNVLIYFTEEAKDYWNL